MDTSNEETRHIQSEQEIACDNIQQGLKETEPQVKIVYKERVLYAGFWIRLWAYIVDLIVVGSLNRILLYPFFSFFDIPSTKMETFSVYAITTTILFYLYFIVMTKVYSQTLGKMVFGLKVFHKKENHRLSWSDIIFREVIGKFISKTVLFLGFILIAFTRKKQGWHDRIADTIVVLERY